MKKNIEKKMAKSIKKLAKTAKKNNIIGTFGTGVATGAGVATGVITVGFIAEKVASVVICKKRSKRSKKKNEGKKNEE